MMTAVRVASGRHGWSLSESEAFGLGLRPGDVLDLPFEHGIAELAWRLDDPDRRVRVTLAAEPGASLLVTLDRVEVDPSPPTPLLTEVG